MKTVYVLGAGFSVEAGAPTQAKLISEAFRLYNQSPVSFDKNRFGVFKDFLVNQLNISDENLADTELEDIFTPLDRCLSERSQYRGIGLDNIIKVREAAFYIVGKTIQLVLNETHGSKQYINQFSNYLTEKSSVRKGNYYRKADPVSVISTSWDILLDNSIHQSIVNSGHDAVVDYCCYISSNDELDESIKPGLEKLGQGGFNVKLLKLHGSLNWLQCPRCMRLYARFSRKEAMHNFENRSSCRHCDANFPEEKNNHLLASDISIPAFCQIILYCGLDKSFIYVGIIRLEASKLIFIGYSLPSADFEMRQLLSRMARRNVDIEVVDYSSDESGKESIKKHWKKFLGKRNISFSFDGAKDYIERLTDGTGANN